MKLGFVLAAWAVAAVSGTIYLWGLAAHVRACRDFFRGVKEMVSAEEICPYGRLTWYDFGVLIARIVVTSAIIMAFSFSLAWATL